MRDRLTEAVKAFLARHGYILARYQTGHRTGWISRVNSIKAERTFLLNHCEACQIISALKATEKIGGDLAEVGVAFGASARLISEYGGGRNLHLFDTFEGLPEIGHKDTAKFGAGQFKSDLESVQRYLAGRRVEFYKGLFPQTAAPVRNTSFSFVHIDVDIYESTMSCLEFFYPRLRPGGILISHDYMSADGVNAAFAEFFDAKPEPVIELTGYQCMVVKLAA